MRRWNVLTVFPLAAAVAAALLVAAATGKPAQRGVEGKFSLILAVQTLASDPKASVPGTAPWSGQLRHGARYSYRSLPCMGSSPVNDISSDLPSYNTRVAGSRVPSSLRGHPFSFRLWKAKGHWEMRGRIVLTVCKLASGPTPNPDPIADRAKPKIYVNFRARLRRVTSEEIRWHGTFTLAGGTRRYAGLKGSGRIAGYFLCFAAEGCKAKGAFLDAQLVMHGDYSDLTPQLGRAG